MAAGEGLVSRLIAETMHVLRAEKGFIIAGQDTDGSVSPQDMDMNWIVDKNKTFVISVSAHGSVKTTSGKIENNLLDC